MQLDPYVAAAAYVIVLLAAMQRFSQPPPVSTKGIWPSTVGELVRVLRSGERPQSVVSDIYPPPRANTSCFDFWLYCIAYAAVNVLFFALVLHVERARDSAQALIGLFDQKFLEPLADTVGLSGFMQQVTLADADPIVLAAVTAAVLPKVPPFRRVEQSLRSFFYRRAAIPARQRREMTRLQLAGYSPHAKSVQEVRSTLMAEGFVPDDVPTRVQGPEVKRLWLQVNILLHDLQVWQARPKYETAFDLLTEADQPEFKTIDRLRDVHARLKPNARACFEAMRQGLEGRAEREQAFIEECRQLLDRVYHFLSRLTLKAHYTERERVDCMKELGFALDIEEPPVPSAEEMAWLAAVLALTVVLPLGAFVESYGKAAAIAGLVYSIALIPILIGRACPNLIKRRDKRLPPICYPLICAAFAYLLGVSFAVVMLSDGDLARGWEFYRTKTYPWSALHVLWTSILAVLMTAGVYPAAAGFAGWRRYREWGSLRDGAIMAVITLVVALVYVRPQLIHLRCVVHPDSDACTRLSGIGLFIVPQTAAFVIGFLVPTWFRANWGRPRRPASGAGSVAGRRRVNAVAITGG